MYNPMVAIEVAAAKATEDPREGRDKQNAKKIASQMVRIGERNLSSTLWKKCGIPPSRAKANIMREFEVTENRPQCHTQIMMRHIKTTAPSSPKMSWRIWTTG